MEATSLLSTFLLALFLKLVDLQVCICSWRYLLFR